MGQTFSFRAWTIRARATVALVALSATTLVAVVGSPAVAATSFEFEVVADTGTAGSQSPAISADGRYVAFDTYAALLPADLNTGRDVYLRDRVDGSLALVSDPYNSGGLTVVDQHSPAISADGDRVLWTQSSFNMGGAGTDTDAVLVRDRSDGWVAWVNQAGSTTGVDTIGNDISDDGTAVVFTTGVDVSAFVPGMTDTNGASDVVMTRLTVSGETVDLSHTVVSVDEDGNGTNNGASWGASLDANGSFVTYLSRGTEDMAVVALQDNVWSWTAGSSAPVTGTGGGAGGFTASQPQVVGDGTIVFLTDEGYETGDVNATADVYRFNAFGQFERLIRSHAGGDLDAAVVSFDVTSDLSAIAFETSATNAIATAPDATGTHVYRRVAAQEAQLVDRTSGGSAHGGDHTDVVLSDTGDVLAFVSPDGLAAGDANGANDVVLATAVETIETSGPVELVSRTPYGYSGNERSRLPSMDHTGRHVAYESQATDLTTDGLASEPTQRLVHVHDRQAATGHTVRTLTGGGALPNGETYGPWISQDGALVGLTSTASNLTPADADATPDVLIWNRAAGSYELVSLTDSDMGVTSGAELVAMSDNSRFVLFMTWQSLEAADTNSRPDLYLRDRSMSTTTFVSGTNDGSSWTGDPFSGDVSNGGDVVFQSGANNLAGTTLPNSQNIYLWRDGESIALSSSATSSATWPRISADGSTVVIAASQLVTGETFSDRQVFAYDVARATFRLLSHTPGGSQTAMTGASTENAQGRVEVSRDGRYVVFSTPAPDLVTDDTSNVYYDVFVHDRDTDTVRQANRASDGSRVPAAATASAIDETGTLVAWEEGFNTYFPADENPDVEGPGSSVAYHDIYLSTYTAAPAVPRTIDDVTLAVVPGEGGPQAGLDEVPIAGIPVESIPFASVAIGAAPLRSIDLDAAPIRSIPIRSIPIRSIPIRSITLSQLPLELDGGWAARLAGTDLEGVPLQTVTLGAVTDLQADPHPLDGVSLADVGIASTPLRSIGIASIALGSTPLQSIPIRSIDTDNDDPSQGVCPLTGDDPTTETQTLANWEALLACLGFSTTLDDGTSLIDIDIAGAPIRSIPIRSIPIRSIDLASAPIRSIPIRSIEIGATPIRSIPIRSIDLAPAPIRSIPIRSIPIRSIGTNVAVSPIRSIPIRSIPIRSIVVDCTDQRVDCSDLETNLQTLGDVADIDPTLVLEGATLEHLGAVLEGYSFGDLMAFGDVTIGDVSDWLDQHTDIEISLADVLVGLLLKTDYPWEQLPVASMRLQNVNPTAEVVDVDLDFSVSGTSVPGSATTVTVTLPPGAAYAPGSSVAAESSAARSPFGSVDDPSVNGSVLTYVLPGDFAGATNVSVSLAYRPGVRLVDEAVSATISITGDDTPLEAMVASAPYGVVERQRADDDPAKAHELGAADTLVVGHIAHAGDVDYYRIRADLVAGRRLSVDLDVPGVDQDLVLYSPVETEGVIDAAPIRSIPLRSIAVEDPGAVGTGETVPPETLQDIPIRSIPIRSISANRDATDERVDVLANEGDAGYYTIQVSGYNGASSPEPYVLRLRVTGPPAELECTSRTLPHAATSTATAAAPAPAGTDTLFIVNRSRIDATYGLGEAQRVVDALATLGQEGVNGHVLAVDDDPAVREAYAAWDLAPCSPNAANAVVDEVVRLVEASHASAGGGDAEHTIPYVVLVGADDVLPQARIPDLTRLSNERDYTPEVGDDNPLAGAFATEHLLSDDPYGDRDPIPWLNRLLYVPDAALGRLVETPDEIIAAVTRFTTWEGSLDPSTATTSVEQTALVTGYDFLADGARAVSAALASSLGTQPRELINETWNRAALQDALLGADMPYVASVNAHFDHHRSLPADGNATHREDDLFTTAEVEDPDGNPDTDPPALDQRLLFSMGCHSGLNVPDVYVSGIEDDDWAQTFARQGAGAYVANTGFGYGDTAAVALSERLMAEFAARMDGSMTVGQAMTYAKQAYASQLGVYGAYDEKVLAEATFYGLPMFRVKDQPTLPAPTSEVAVSAVAGAGPTVASVPFALDAQDLAITSETAPDGSTFLISGGDAPQVTSGRPIVPRTDRDVTADTGVPARGVLLTGLTSSEQTGVRSTFARAIVDHSSREPAIATDVAFPASFASVNRFRDQDGERSSLVLMPGQFVPDGDPATIGVGTQRRFTGMAVVVYYSDDDDVTPPTFSSTSARANATTATFTADIADGDVLRVLVLYRDAGDAWKSAELAPAPTGTGSWTGSGPVADDEIEYLVQAVDTAGNVATTTNKGFLFAAAADAVPPTVAIASPTAGTYEVGASVPLEFTCDDANLDGCTGTLNGAPVASGGTVDTSAAAGFNELVVTATDRYGNTTTETVTFHIGYTFGGFAAPIAAGQRSEVKAGSAVPVRWQLTDADGYVSDRSAIADIRSYPVDCGATAEAPATLGDTTEVSGLSYDTETDEWKYVWKTEREWRGTCRQLVVSFSDGQTASAVFQLR